MSFTPKGIIPPVVTPTDEYGAFNESSYRKLIRHLLDNGVHGLFPFGTTGEFYAFHDDVFCHTVEIAVEEAQGKVPVYAGANHITPSEVIRLAGLAQKAGASALSVLTPMFISQTNSEIYQYYKTIAENTDLPVIIYNNKPKTNVTVEPSIIARLAEEPNIIGVKDSTGDMTNAMEYIRLTRHIENFSVLMGRDTLIFPALCCGATGAIASCANVAPGVAVEIYEKFIAGDYAGALEAQFRFAPLRLACSMGTFPQVIKEGLNLVGVSVGNCLPPIQELTAEEKAHLTQVLQKMKILPQA